MSGVSSTKILFHAEIERRLHGLDRHIAAIWITREIRFAHAADVMCEAAAIGDRRGEGQKEEVAARDKGIWQTVLLHDDLDITCHRRR